MSNDKTTQPEAQLPLPALGLSSAAGANTP